MVGQLDVGVIFLLFLLLYFDAFEFVDVALFVVSLVSRVGVVKFGVWRCGWWCVSYLVPVRCLLFAQYIQS